MIFEDEVAGLKEKRVRFTESNGSSKDTVTEGILEGMSGSGATAIISVDGDSCFVNLKNIYRMDAEIPDASCRSDYLIAKYASRINSLYDLLVFPLLFMDSPYCSGMEAKKAYIRRTRELTGFEIKEPV